VPTLLSEAEGKKREAVKGEVFPLHSGVVDPMHAEKFNVRNLGDPGWGLG
jgi:hypothetical protein